MPLNTKYFELTIPGFEGFESVSFYKNRVFFLAEASRFQKMKAFLLSGEFKSWKKGIELIKYREIPSKMNISNMAFEASFFQGNKLYMIYEANGKRVNKSPYFLEYDLSKNNFTELNFENVEFRITDSTMISNDTVWFMNYLWGGEKELLKANMHDDESNQIASLEQIIEYRFKDRKFELQKKMIVQKTSNKKEQSNNWEGLAKIEQGFLACTDHYPYNRISFLRPK